jgi:pyruvate decarboxylase
MVPVLHIVGVPSTGQQDAKALLHHTLGDGRFVCIRRLVVLDLTGGHRYDAYSKAAQQFTISQASLASNANATIEIDRLLTDCITKVCKSILILPFALITLL